MKKFFALVLVAVCVACAALGCGSSVDAPRFTAPPQVPAALGCVDSNADAPTPENFSAFGCDRSLAT